MERFDKGIDPRNPEAKRKSATVTAMGARASAQMRMTEFVAERLQKKIGVRRTINAALRRRDV